jgi:hypothetical protein
VKKQCGHCTYNNPNSNGHELGCAANPLYWQQSKPEDLCNDYSRLPWSRERGFHAAARLLANCLNLIPYKSLLWSNHAFIILLIFHLLYRDNPYLTLRVLLWAAGCFAGLLILKFFGNRLDSWIIKKYPHRLNQRQTQKALNARLHGFMFCYIYLDSRLERFGEPADAFRDQLRTLDFDNLCRLAVDEQQFTSFADWERWFFKN